MVPEGFLPHLQVPANCPYPETDQSSPRPSPSYFLKIHLNIIPHLRLGLPSGFLPWGFTTKTCIHLASPHTCYIPSQSHSSRFDNPNKSDEDYRSVSTSLCSFLPSPVSPSLVGPNIILSTLVSNTISLHSSLNVSDQVSHTYKTTGNIIVLYTLPSYF